MITYIEAFIASKTLSLNSQKAYQYDLQQFSQVVGNVLVRTNCPFIKTVYRQLAHPLKNERYLRLISFCITCIRKII